MSAQSKAWHVFAGSNTDSNPTRGMVVFLRFFCNCVVLCASRALATGSSPVQIVLPSIEIQISELIDFEWA
jgi:hypothetical protein